MKLTKEETIKAIEICFSDRGCNECPLHCPDEDCSDLLLKNALHHLKENEPAPSANDTSSKCNELQNNDIMKLKICQAMIKSFFPITSKNNGELYNRGYLQSIKNTLDILDKI